MYSFMTESKLLSSVRLLNTNWCHVKDFILGINDNGVRDLEHSMYHRDLGFLSHLILETN